MTKLSPTEKPRFKMHALRVAIGKAYGDTNSTNARKHIHKILEAFEKDEEAAVRVFNAIREYTPPERVPLAEQASRVLDQGPE